MKLEPMNTSLASFQVPNGTLLYLDPYNNTLGEKNQFIVFYVIILSISCICAVYLMFGVIMFEKYGLNPDNRSLLDMLISFAMILNIIQSGPTMILLVHRNVIGPLQNQDIVVGLLSIRTFTQISTLMILIEGLFVWYITEKAFKNQVDMDEIGMAECCQFFTVSLSAGVTLIVSRVGYFHHQNIKRYMGLPLDFSDKYLIHTR